MAWSFLAEVQGHATFYGKEDFMRILKMEPGKAPYEKEIENELDAIQQEVDGGLFQVFYMGDGTIMCCNDEGKLNGMEMNRRFCDDIICGPFFMVGDAGSDFRSLTDEEVQRYSEQFAEPDQFADYEPNAEPRIEFIGF